ncbi:DUF4296 domain-containing protein [Emticicia sp. CRIBPO]|uniref:DUF4296 domain-containing protein n=1 Tax=Emticicia sp. CRIBPO TaxID=2683258 RepID=UPI00210443E0|nr:DUF4296 domain-containing protein [Emticicia sp. CRIBPO]
MFLVSCGKSPQNSSKQIDKKTMANIIAELQIVEAKVSRLNFQGVDSAKVAFNHYQEKIFKKYKIDSVTYGNNYRYYSEKPALFIEVYDDVVKILESKRDTVKTKK